MPTETLTFGDLIKKSVLENFTQATGTLTLSKLLIGLSIALLISLFIFVIYKKTYNGVMYNRSFNVSLVLLTIVTALILMTVTSNLALSLGMVGALSIVRFRTAVKEALDTAYMFWAIAAGISVGAGYYMVGIGGSLFIGIVMMLMSLLRFKGAQSYLLVIRHHPDSGPDVKAMMTRLPKHKIKSRVVARDHIEITAELSLRSENTGIVANFLKIEGVETAMLVSYSGDYTA